MSRKPFDRAGVKALRDELNAVLARHAAATGLTISFGNAKFTPESVDFKVSVTIPGGKSVTEDKLDAGLAYVLKVYKLTKITPTKELVGYDSRKHKYPFIYRDRLTGKRYKTTLASAKVWFAASPISDRDAA